MAFDYESLAGFINGHGRIFPDDLAALPVSDERDSEVDLLRAENVRLRDAALAQVELILIGLRGAICYSGDE